MDHVLTFTPDGKVRGMHTDKFNLGFLGDQRITRASEIIWDEKLQRWDIWFVAPGGVLQLCSQFADFPGYDVARKFEVMVMNEAALRGVHPTDPSMRDWVMSKR